MGQLRATGFVGADTLRLIAWPSLLVMVGDIGCLGDLVVSTEKYLEIVTPDASPDDALAGDGDILVRTLIYSYNASVRGRGTIFRYDNNHGRAGHADWHHVHRCDWRSSDDDGTVAWIGEDRWPTLGEVVRELMDWYYEHRNQLPTPDDYAVPLVREPRIVYH
jgi:hypothetical protein